MTEIDCWDIDGRLTLELERVGPQNLELVWFDGEAVQLDRRGVTALRDALTKFLDGEDL